MSSDKQRLILAVQNALLPDATKQTSFIPMAEDEMWSMLYGAGLWLGPRKALEELPTFRQIIPYVALSVDGKIVKYVRTPAGGETRLHGKVSIGLGGHVDLADIAFTEDGINLESTLETAVAREVLEEIGEVEVISKSWLGIIVANDNPVDFVHIGAAAVWELASMPAGVVEDAIGEVSLATIEDLHNLDVGRMETWSYLLMGYLAFRAAN